MNNLYSTIDYALGSEWPESQQPRKTNVFHDALYRVAGVEYEYRQGDGSWNARSGPITDWRDEQQFHQSADPMRREPAPMVSELPDERPRAWSTSTTGSPT